jgi:hypothetical protein
MTYKDFLDILAAWASILTAAVAVLAYAVYRYERYAKRRRLENYLQAEKARGVDKGQRTLTHLVANVGMSESDILDCAFRSKHIARTVDVKDGKAVGLFLEYES